MAAHSLCMTSKFQWGFNTKLLTHAYRALGPRLPTQESTINLNINIKFIMMRTCRLIDVRSSFIAPSWSRTCTNTCAGTRTGTCAGLCMSGAKHAYACPENDLDEKAVVYDSAQKRNTISNRCTHGLKELRTHGEDTRKRRRRR